MKTEVMIDDSPFVSICVTAYNHESFIEECLDSLLAQETTFSYEICIGEDESSDRTREICKRYAAENPKKIRLFLRSRKDVIYINGKPTGRFNFIKTLEAGRGKYLAICEGDDYWVDKEKLQVQIEALENNPSCALCFCNVQVVYDDGMAGHKGYGKQDSHNHAGRIGVFALPDRESNIKTLARGNFIHTPGVVFRNWLHSDPLPHFMLSVGFGDWPLHMCTAQRGNLLYIDTVFAAYRVHAGGIWSRSSEINKVISTIETSCLLLNSHEFTYEVNEQLCKGIKFRMRQLWKISIKKKENDQIYGTWISSFEQGGHSLLNKMIKRYARRYKFRTAYRVCAGIIKMNEG
jgi:glycosyltransferase involved in cell wall biosynthesis